MPNQYLPGVVTTPSALLITGITQSMPMQVSFTVPPTGFDSYVLGQLVVLTVPRTWGMYQANGLKGKIIQLGMGTMKLAIDSTGFDPFVYAPNSGEGPASLAPAGAYNLQFDNFTNSVPFKSLNNIGN